MKVSQEEFYSATGTYSYLLGMPGVRGKILIDPTEDCIDDYSASLGRVGRDRVFILETGSVSTSSRGSEAIARRWRTRRIVPCDWVQGPDLMGVGHGDSFCIGGMAVEVLGRVGRLNEAVSYRIADRAFVGDRCAHQEPELMMLPVATQLFRAHSAHGDNRDTLLSARGVLAIYPTEWKETAIPIGHAPSMTTEAGFRN